MAYACPYCRSNIFDDDNSLRCHMSVCPRHPGSKFVSEYNEEAIICAYVVWCWLVANHMTIYQCGCKINDNHGDPDKICERHSALIKQGGYVKW